jgi:hypothetical protein
MNNSIKDRVIKGNKKAVCSISLILLLSLSIMLVFTQTASAQVGIPQPEKSVGYASVAPTLIGVGQSATVNLWIYPLPSNWVYQPYFKGFVGITVTFVKPDGTQDTFKPVDGTGQYVAGETQALGALYFTYTPSMAGNWSISFTMPAQNLTDATGTVQYQGCTSNTAYFTVQTAHVNAGLLDGSPWSPLPNANVYWTHPISANNREWSAITGDWLGSGTQGSNVVDPSSRLWNPYSTSPNTAHIVWSQPLTEGGLIGGDYGSLSYTVAINNPTCVILDGRVYINIPNSGGMFECLDETTGKVLYTATGSISNGIHLPGNAAAQANLDPSVLLTNSYGAIPTPYLFGASGTTWNYYDPLTGALLKSIVNATLNVANATNPAYNAYQTSQYYNSYRLIDGTNLAYGVIRGTMFAWDLSKVVNNNWPTGITWKVNLPLPIANRSLMLIGTSTDGSTLIVRGNPDQFWGYSAKDGSLLWGPVTLTYAGLVNEQITLYGVDDFIVYDPVAATFHCYSDTTGKELWTSPSFSSAPWATTWTIYGAETNDYNNLYLMFPDGTMAALSLTTGQQVWRSTAISSTEYPNNAVPFVCGMVMIGGNIYGYAGYSTLYQLDPMPRFGMMVCVNATTGNITYTLNGGLYPIAGANGYVLAVGMYDETLYCVGKGQTTTTVSAPQTAITSGTTVMISGSVLDQSAAQPNTAAISDANMSEWMDYTHMQNSTLVNNPPQCDGIPVTLTAVDSNGNAITIGTATSDYKGNYGLQWTPTTSGLYHIYATFTGSNSYYTSSATTYATVSITPSSTPAPTLSVQSSVSNSDMIMYFAITATAIIIAIAVVGALLLRKRP